jgi:DNA-binding response OmpR family regulator
LKVKILLVEGKRTEKPLFAQGLIRKGYQVESVPSGSAALEALTGGSHHLVLVNAASLRTSGKRICQSIRRVSSEIPIVVIVDQVEKNFDRLEANVVLTLPFTLQKLINRIKPLLPVERKDVLEVGELQMDTEQRFVRYQNRQVRLTPRLVILLKVLMEHPGEVIEREQLFKLVWDTAYTGDTRSLDVHVSWLRQALEDDPRNPKIIKTVRGVGYRLDIDEHPLNGTA